MAGFDVEGASVIGNSNEAINWVDGSSLSSEYKELLLRFVRRFPSMMFVKDRDSRLLREVESKEGLLLPDWFHEVRQTLCFVEPRMQVRFDDFDSYTPRADYLDEIWYSVGLISMGDEQRRLFVEEARVCPMAEWVEENRSFLAVQLNNPGDTRVHEFSAPDLLDNVLDGKPAGISVHPAFDSYPSMLSHVTAGKLPDGTVIKAR
ncbi:hypothetical protein [Streptomyces malaysiensis]|uniref:hypothetical protein n=1 Tax=Streptomyces malaysiensis TaxID=92644 RepID=UPI0011CDE4AB|nr:hypothetical protein [Streptomyces malaysiensis]